MVRKDVNSQSCQKSEFFVAVKATVFHFDRIRVVLLFCVCLEYVDIGEMVGALGTFPFVRFPRMLRQLRMGFLINSAVFVAIFICYIECGPKMLHDFQPQLFTPSTRSEPVVFCPANTFIVFSYIGYEIRCST